MYENAFIYYNSFAAHRIPELRDGRRNISDPASTTTPLPCHRLYPSHCRADSGFSP